MGLISWALVLVAVWCVAVSARQPTHEPNGDVVLHVELGQHASVPGNTYTMLNNTDATGWNVDIGHADTNNVTELQWYCDSMPSCVGFNSNGWIKQNVSQGVQYNAPGTLLYIRQNPIPLELTMLWPLPASFSNGSDVISIDSRTFRFMSPSPFPDLDDAFHRYTHQTFPHATLATPTGPTLTALSVTVVNNNVPLQLGVDESYSLIIPEDGSAATLNANTYYGALRGLETFSQLVVYNFDTMSYALAYVPWYIKDYPRFPHRGLLVDSSRHFEPVDTIKAVIQSMTYAKLNVLHWHITDAQSFPLQSLTYPFLWNGSWSPQERFTQDDAADVVEYARQRGIRVIPEFDMPGHADAWCVGYPEVCPSLECASPLNPATDATFTLIDSFMGELTGGARGEGLFFDNTFHLGGDEVDTSCWSETPAIQAWMNQNNYSTDDAFFYFVQRAHDIIIAQGRDPTNWEEVFNFFGSKLDPQTIVQVWLDHATLAEVVAAGYRGVLSNNDVWYLDHLTTTWEQFYLNDPLANITVPAQQALVLGGEVCMWGETVDTSDIQQTIWPRAAAAAERLWSPPVPTAEIPQAMARLQWFRCLLNSRGVAAAPVNNDMARQSPSGPSPCLLS